MGVFGNLNLSMHDWIQEPCERGITNSWDAKVLAIAPDSDHELIIIELIMLKLWWGVALLRYIRFKVWNGW